MGKNKNLIQNKQRWSANNGNGDIKNSSSFSCTAKRKKRSLLPKELPPFEKTYVKDEKKYGLYQLFTDPEAFFAIEKDSKPTKNASKSRSEKRKKALEVIEQVVEKDLAEDEYESESSIELLRDEPFDQIAKQRNRCSLKFGKRNQPKKTKRCDSPCPVATFPLLTKNKKDNIIEELTEFIDNDSLISELQTSDEESTFVDTFSNTFQYTATDKRKDAIKPKTRRNTCVKQGTSSSNSFINSTAIKNHTQYNQFEFSQELSPISSLHEDRDGYCIDRQTCEETTPDKQSRSVKQLPVAKKKVPVYKDNVKPASSTRLFTTNLSGMSIEEPDISSIHSNLDGCKKKRTKVKNANRKPRIEAKEASTLVEKTIHCDMITSFKPSSPVKLSNTVQHKQSIKQRKALTSTPTQVSPRKQAACSFGVSTILTVYDSMELVPGRESGHEANSDEFYQSYEFEEVDVPVIQNKAPDANVISPTEINRAEVLVYSETVTAMKYIEDLNSETIIDAGHGSELAVEMNGIVKDKCNEVAPIEKNNVSDQSIIEIPPSTDSSCLRNKISSNIRNSAKKLKHERKTSSSVINAETKNNGKRGTSDVRNRPEGGSSASPLLKTKKLKLSLIKRVKMVTNENRKRQRKNRNSSNFTPDVDKKDTGKAFVAETPEECMVTKLSPVAHNAKRRKRASVRASRKCKKKRNKSSIQKTNINIVNSDRSNNSVTPGNENTTDTTLDVNLSNTLSKNKNCSIVTGQLKKSDITNEVMNCSSATNDIKNCNSATNDIKNCSMVIDKMEKCRYRYVKDENKKCSMVTDHMDDCNKATDDIKNCSMVSVQMKIGSIDQTKNTNSSMGTYHKDSSAVSSKNKRSRIVTKANDHSCIVAKVDKYSSTVTKENENSSIVTKENTNSSIVTKENENSSIVTKENKNSSIVTKENENASIVTKENKNSSIVTKENENSSIVTKEKKNSSIVTKENENSSIVTKQNDHCSSLTKDNDHSNIVTMDSEQYDIVTKENGHSDCGIVEETLCRNVTPNTQNSYVSDQKQKNSKKGEDTVEMENLQETCIIHMDQTSPLQFPKENVDIVGETKGQDINSKGSMKPQKIETCIDMQNNTKGKRKSAPRKQGNSQRQKKITKLREKIGREMKTWCSVPRQRRRKKANPPADVLNCSLQTLADNFPAPIAGPMEQHFVKTGKMFNRRILAAPPDILCQVLPPPVGMSRESCGKTSLYYFKLIKKRKKKQMKSPILS